MIERPVLPYPSVLKVLSPKARVWADAFDNGELRAEEGGVVLSGGVVRYNSRTPASAIPSLLRWAAAGGAVRGLISHEDHPEVDVQDGCGLIGARLLERTTMMPILFRPDSSSFNFRGRGA
jgi:hypothetical protein